MRDSGEAADYVRVLIVAGDPLARQGLSSLLARADGTIEAGQATPHDALSLSRESRADVALWDLHLEAAAEAPNFPEVCSLLPVLALLSDSTRAAEALASGARGTLPRDCDAVILAAALRAVAVGLHVLDESAALALLRRRDAARQLLEPLTAREQEVLDLLSLGSTNRAIARRLGISEHTAKFHVNAILAKLDAESRTEAVVKAARLGLVLL